MPLYFSVNHSGIVLKADIKNRVYG